MFAKLNPYYLNYFPWVPQWDIQANIKGNFCNKFAKRVTSNMLQFVKYEHLYYFFCLFDIFAIKELLKKALT